MVKCLDEVKDGNDHDESIHQLNNPQLESDFKFKISNIQMTTLWHRRRVHKYRIYGKLCFYLAKQARI